MTNNPQNNTGGNLEWFTKNLPISYLTYPEQYLYNCALEVEELEDIAENRRQFKACLVERKVSESMELEEIDQKDASEFMNPDDPELKVKRSEELVKLTQKHLDQKNEFTEASRLAFLELFHKEAPFKVVEMDEGYFTNRELVKADLEAFLGISKYDCLENLTTSNPVSFVKVTTQSGKITSWPSYLQLASKFLLGTTYKKGNVHKIARVLKKLKEVCGLRVSDFMDMDEDYFKNTDRIKQDMHLFLKKMGFEYFGDLSTNSIYRNIPITRQSGETITWHTYLQRASRSYFGTKGHGKSLHRISDALKKIKEICGVIEMDESYFNNPEILKKDLEPLLSKLKKGNSITCLTSENPRCITPIITQSGETLTWGAYLTHVSVVYFGTSMSKDIQKPHRPSDALKKLKEICGAIEMDESYFNNPEILKKDLNSYLKKGKGGSILNLSTRNPSEELPVITQSGESIQWVNYLNRASSIYFDTKGGGNSKRPHRRGNALKKLKEICGVIEMDENYFNNPEILKKDLEPLLSKLKKGNSITCLTSENPRRTTPIITQSGKTLTWGAYLAHASVVYFGTSMSKDIQKPHRPSDALKKIKEICGAIEMDESYFNNPEILKKDLNSYLKKMRGNSLDDLSVSKPPHYTVIITQSGEEVRWVTYLNRASRTLLRTKGMGKKFKNPHRISDVLKKLKEIANKANDK